MYVDICVCVFVVSDIGLLQCYCNGLFAVFVRCGKLGLGLANQRLTFGTWFVEDYFSRKGSTMDVRFIPWRYGPICQGPGCNKHGSWQVMDTVGQDTLASWFCRKHAELHAVELNEEHDG